MKVSFCSIILAGFVLAGLAVSAGCTAPRNPWVYTTPPTTAEPRPAVTRSDANRTAIVLGTFADPTKAPHYSSGVGKCMSDALARALLNDAKFDIWINPQLSRAVEEVIALPTFQHDEALGAIGRDNPRVHYVITGKVTDFHHTADLPAAASRWGLLGRRNEAIAAIDLRIVDLKTRRVVGADHLKGVVGAGSTPSDETYGGIALDSYLFWTTPLGRASKAAVELAVDRTERVVPGGHIGDARIAAIAPRRRLNITGGTDAGLSAGREYFIVTFKDDAEGKAIFDPDTDLPLTVRIDSVTRHAASGILRGRPPIEVDIRGASLRTALPPIRAATRPPETPGLNDEPVAAVTAGGR